MSLDPRDPSFIKVLIVDPDYYLRDRLRQLLIRKSNHVLEAVNAQEGYDLYRNENPQIVVCEHQLSGFYGSELVEKIKTFDYSTRILLITKSCPDDLLLNLLRLNRFVALHKPIEPMLFLRAIQFLMSAPDVPKSARRSAYRIDTVIPTNVGGKGYGRTKNISLNGAFIEISGEFKLGDRISLQLFLPEELVIGGRIVWTRFQNKGETTPSGIGVQFDADLEPKLIHQLTDFILKVMNKKTLVWWNSDLYARK